MKFLSVVIRLKIAKQKNVYVFFTITAKFQMLLSNKLKVQDVLLGY